MDGVGEASEYGHNARLGRAAVFFVGAVPDARARSINLVQILNSSRLEGGMYQCSESLKCAACGKLAAVVKQQKPILLKGVLPGKKIAVVVEQQ